MILLCHVFLCRAQRTVEFYGVPTNYFVCVLLLFAAVSQILMTVLGPQSAMLFLLSAGIVYCFTHISTGDFQARAVTKRELESRGSTQNGAAAESRATGGGGSPHHANGADDASTDPNRRKKNSKKQSVSRSNHDRNAFGKSVRNNDSSIEVSFNPVRFSFAELWCIWMLGVALFFATGHSNVFSSINVRTVIVWYSWLHNQFGIDQVNKRIDILEVSFNPVRFSFAELWDTWILVIVCCFSPQIIQMYSAR